MERGDEARTIGGMIDMLRLLLICGLVFLHYGAFAGMDWTPSDGVRLPDFQVAQFVNAFVLFFFYCAVPVLSVMSGYLFFDRAGLTLARYRTKVGRRVWTMFIPMVLWNAMLLALLGAVVLAKPGTMAFVLARFNLEGFAPHDIVNALFGFTAYPVGFHFWFLRDLILAVVLSPVLYFLLRYAAYVFGAVLVGVWFAGLDIPPFFRTDVLVFFYIGGLVRLKGLPVYVRAGRWAAVLLAVFAALVAVRAAAPLLVPPETLALTLIEDYGTRVMRLVGVLAMGLSAPFLYDTAFGRALAARAGLAFYLYAAHWPLNQGVKRAYESIGLSGSDALFVVNFVATTLTTIALVALSAMILHRVFPGLLALLSGGRLAGPAGTGRA